MGNQLDSDLSEERRFFLKHKGRRYLPDHCLQVLPEKWKSTPGSLMTFYRCVPPGVRFLGQLPDNLYWWPDVCFVPHTERSLVTSMGAFLDRPGFTDMAAYNPTHGLLYTMTYGERLKCSIIKRTQTSSVPNVDVHPGGNAVVWVGRSCITIMNLTTLWQAKRDNDVRNNNFRKTVITPNGRYIAVMSRCSSCIELETFLVESSFFIKQFYINCHTVCPGFKTHPRHQAKFECKFSADGEYIACASSNGQLFVVKRYELKPVCTLIPGVLDESQARISNERSFDFDPRYLHKYLTFCDDNSVLYISDIIDGTIIFTRDLETEAEVQCLKYSPAGNILGMAFSDGTIGVYHADSFDLLHTLDATSLEPDCRMVLDSQGLFPSLIKMSYSSTGNLLATTSTDGIVRVWQMWPDLSLQALCRRSILQHVPMKKLVTLPLPVKVITYLLQWPEE